MTLVSVFTDIDGTLDTGEKGTIHPPVIPLLAQCVDKGHYITFITNRSRAWIGAHLLRPLFQFRRNPQRGRIFAACEQAATISEVSLHPNSPIYTFEQIASWPLENRQSIELAILQAIDRGVISGNLREGLEYQVCLELSPKAHSIPTLDEVRQWLPLAARDVTRVVRTRSTITFLNRNAGKDVAARFLLDYYHPVPDFCFGIGDDADEFALVVPTLDVDRLRRNTFKKPGYHAASIDDPQAFDRLGLRPFLNSIPSQTELSRGTGFATAAVLASLLQPVEYK